VRESLQAAPVTQEEAAAAAEAARTAEAEEAAAVNADSQGVDIWGLPYRT